MTSITITDLALNARAIELANDVVQFANQSETDGSGEIEVFEKWAVTNVEDLNKLENDVTSAIDTGNMEALADALYIQG